MRGRTAGQNRDRPLSRQLLGCRAVAPRTLSPIRKKPDLLISLLKIVTGLTGVFRDAGEINVYRGLFAWRPQRSSPEILLRCLPICSARLSSGPSVLFRARSASAAFCSTSTLAANSFKLRLYSL